MSLIPTAPKPYLEQIETIMYDFVWNDKPARIRKKVLQNSKDNGGEDMVDLDLKDCCLKLNWLSRLVHTPGTWCDYVSGNVIPHSIQDTTYFLECNLLWKDYPIRINPNSIWFEVMKYWCEVSFKSASVFVEVGKILDINLWYNTNIRIKNLPIFWLNWYNNGIRKIYDIIHDSEPKFLSWNELRTKYKINGNYLHYLGLLAALPKNWTRHISESTVGKHNLLRNSESSLTTRLLKSDKSAKLLYKYQLNIKMTNHLSGRTNGLMI